MFDSYEKCKTTRRFRSDSATLSRNIAAFHILAYVKQATLMSQCAQQNQSHFFLSQYCRILPPRVCEAGDLDVILMHTKEPVTFVKLKDVISHAGLYPSACIRSHSCVTQRHGGGVGGVSFPGKKRYEGVLFNVISVTSGGWGSNSLKKRYVTLAWPFRSRSVCTHSRVSVNNKSVFAGNISVLIE